MQVASLPLPLMHLVPGCSCFSGFNGMQRDLAPMEGALLSTSWSRALFFLIEASASLSPQNGAWINFPSSRYYRNHPSCELPPCYYPIPHWRCRTYLVGFSPSTSALQLARRPPHTWASHRLFSLQACKLLTS